MKLSDIILEGWTPEKFTTMGKTRQSEFTGQSDNLQDFLKALDRLPDTIKSIKVPIDTKLHKTSADKKTIVPNQGWKQEVEQIVKQVVDKANEEGSSVDQFILATYGGQFEKDPSTAEYYIDLRTSRSREFGKDMASGKYGSLD